ncbi:phosphomannomutase [Kosakonia oryzae]|uniref:Phosphomannomutase n=1 Tax=Kosakonia oryzae TaxID=497725 RepID=A0AA94KQ93_9ENTR|nr:phosphomannomutase [Kosakonia oryzae]ANI82291.1 phosphomannomutase [Kosakonia oryzae]SFC53493.1 phosphomannomutase [Kosakonia oryzae]
MNTIHVISNSGIVFGTSGARGLVKDFTPAVCMAFTHAFVNLLKKESSLTTVALGIDNRPSSYSMAQACAAALYESGIEPIFYGVLPTPALALVARKNKIPCIMVTGSHIPFDRNGLKFYKKDGEITKLDEIEITKASVDFNMPATLPKLELCSDAEAIYIERYTSLFNSDLLSGKRIGIYEHSSAGREIYHKIFTALGAEVIRLARSDEFVPIDTEAVTEEDKSKALQWSKEHHLDAIFSTDGDGDRPMLADEKGEWLRGDILGLLCSRELHIEAVAIPVSCNTAVQKSNFFKRVELTRIGSPYVIDALSKLQSKFVNVAGFEANGGYLLGSNITYNNVTVDSLPTRDAVLPAVIVIAAAQHRSISELILDLPERYTHSDRLQNFPQSNSSRILQEALVLPEVFIRRLGINGRNIQNVDQTDGVRLTLDDGSIIHLRPSGNAPELRCYAESSSSLHARKLVDQVLGNIKYL